MHSREETERILEEARNGGARAFEKLVTPHLDRLESIIHLRLGKRLRLRVDVEDVLQETLMRAHTSLVRFEWRDQGSFFRWLGAIAEHVVKDLARHHFSSTRGGLDREVRFGAPSDGGGLSAGERLQAPNVSPSRSMRREERLERLEDALEKLSPEHREVILLAHLQGLPTKEVAQRMGRSRPAAAMLLLRATRELKGLFGNTDSLGLEPHGLGGQNSGPPT